MFKKICLFFYNVCWRLELRQQEFIGHVFSSQPVSANIKIRGGRGRGGLKSASLQDIQTLNEDPGFQPRREDGDVWCLPPVWNLRAVIWFPFPISSLLFSA